MFAIIFHTIFVICYLYKDKDAIYLYKDAICRFIRFGFKTFHLLAL